jgi:hypothetical protein
MTLDDIRRLNFREAGNWPLLPKIAVLGLLVVLILVAGAFFDWKDQIDALDRAQDEEAKLRIPKLLQVEHWLYDSEQPGIYNGAGLYIVNPPYAFTQALPPLMEALRAALAPDGHRGKIISDWLGD